MENKLIEIRNKLGEKKQVSDSLYCTIKEAVAIGVLQPGHRLKEEELAEIFQVSRTPVRDALKKLEIEELIASDSSQGAIVKKMELDECLDTLEMLEWLRTTAIDMLMGRISRSILMMLEANTRKGESLTDPKLQYENNAEFHELLIKATGNSVLYSISKRLQFKEKIIVNNILPYHYSKDYILHHRNLLKAIINNNTEYVRQYAESNKEKANNYMNQLISKFLE